MLRSFILPAGVILNVAPYAFLCFIPFRKRLRFPIHILGLVLLLIAAIEFLIYFFVRNMPYFVEQVIFFGFFAVYFVVYLCSIRIKISKLIFIFLVTADYAAIVIGISNYLEIHFFPNCSHVGGYSGQLILLHLMVYSVTVPASTYILMKKIVPLLEIENKAWKRLWIIPLMYLLTIVTFSGSDSDRLVSGWQYITVTVTMAIAGYVVLYIIIEMLIKTDETANLRENFRMMEILIGFQKRDYEQMSRQIVETRIARHDLRRNLLLVEEFVRSGKYAELQVFLDNFKNTLPQSAEEEAISENKAVNAILQYYNEIAKAESIRLWMNVQIPKLTEYSDVELCIVFGNCIENAIEACRAVSEEQRYIRIKARMHGDILGIVIDNGFDGNVKVVDGRFISKKRGNAEGIGLSSVKAIAEKYSGKAIFTFNKSEFQASVILHNLKKEI